MNQDCEPDPLGYGGNSEKVALSGFGVSLAGGHEKGCGPSVLAAVALDGIGARAGGFMRSPVDTDHVAMPLGAFHEEDTVTAVAMFHVRHQGDCPLDPFR